MDGIVELLASMIKASVVLDDEEKIELTVPFATTFMGSSVVYDMIRYYLSISTCLHICIFWRLARFLQRVSVHTVKTTRFLQRDSKAFWQ
jgi:hypothetical protein